MTARDRKRLGASDQRLIEKVDRVLQTMAAIDAPMMVTGGARTASQQRALYVMGRSKPGKIVTNADGVNRKSQHQRGRAADLCFLTPEGEPTWEGPWDLLGATAEQEGLVWGGTWRSFPDRPHVELPEDVPEGTVRA